MRSNKRETSKLTLENFGNLESCFDGRRDWEMSPRCLHHLENDPVLTGTALIYDERMTEPRMLWESSIMPEGPEAVISVMRKIHEYGLFERCVQIEARSATQEEILLVHRPNYVELLKSTENMSTEELRSVSDTHDLVYLHPKSYSSACLAVGCMLQLVDKVMGAQVKNGLAVVRPPGHNAHREKADGYCIFNTLAIAACYAKQKHGVERILIVDWDIHHGQATQYIFEDDPRVLYFSIHRYEHGDFWPYLADSDCTAVGTGRGEGFNINVPWNTKGMSDADYIAVFHRLLLPVAHEFRPKLILVAAGFDSTLGDPKGKMSTTPACFAHLTHMLMPLANGKLLLALEGGYNFRSTAESACTCLKVLLGDPCPRLESPFIPCQSALESISAVISVHRRYWKCLQNHEASSWHEMPQAVEAELPAVDVAETLDRTMAEVMRSLPADRTGLVYDERMKEHYNMWDSQHPELPQRISEIYARHKELHLVERCHLIPAQPASESDLEMCHGSEYIGTLKATGELKPRDLHRQACEYNSIYISPKSYDSAVLAVGSTFNVVEAVLTGKVQNGVAIVRPPGHHAEKDLACGFCFFNNVALAARFAQNLVGRKMRVLILDWDVHHGNGTQHMFEDDPSVLYISLHRYDRGSFFPVSEDGDYDKVGREDGEGFNVNIPWNGSRMGDSEYMVAFQRVVLPISYQFQPELVLISAGFDAARGDPLGGCQVTPECYAHMTHLMLGLAGGRVVLALEGGYNLTSIAESMSMCTWTLLGDTPPQLERLKVPSASAMQSISNVITQHNKYWTSLRLNVDELDLPAPSLLSLTAPTSNWPRPETPSPTTSSRGETPPDGRASEEMIKGLSLVSLAASSSLTAPGVRSVAVGGARPKVKANAELESAALASPSERRPEVEGRESPKPRIPETGSGKQDRQGEVPDGANSPDVSVSTSTISSSKVQTDSEEELLAHASGRASSRCVGPTPAADPGELFAVTPLSWCPHLEMVQPIPTSGLNVSQVCEDCGSVGENWVCLTCFQVHCGRYVNEHMVLHSVNSGHLIVLSYADLSAWCYSCDSYVHNEVLIPAKKAAHRLKFGEEYAGLD
ncbi:histone deacetylase 6 [Heptranchias perlo]|uniref:histone deacetylase 6 n=1 Tax=Heptranchias perlo TaxID=212740 RepID=UPI003559FD80